jgi:peroxin-5
MRSADPNGFTDAWNEINNHQAHHFQNTGSLTNFPLEPARLQPNLDGPPQRVLSSFLHSFVNSSHGGVPFRSAALPVLGLSESEKKCIRDRSSIMARHFFADKSEEFVNSQVNALLSSLDIENDMRGRGGGVTGRYRELEEFWNDSSQVMNGGGDPNGWANEFTQHMGMGGGADPNAWAHSFQQQHGPAGWASEFEHEQSQITTLDHMRGANIPSLAAMEQTRMLAHTLAQNEDPKFQNSKFFQFVSKMSRGELSIEDNQVKASSAGGDWATEYQHQHFNNGGGQSWADQFVREEMSSSSHGPERWVNEYSREREKHVEEDEWVSEFSKLHVHDWVDEFGRQVGEGALGDESSDQWAHAYDE